MCAVLCLALSDAVMLSPESKIMMLYTWLAMSPLPLKALHGYPCAWRPCTQLVIVLNPHHGPYPNPHHNHFPNPNPNCNPTKHLPCARLATWEHAWNVKCKTAEVSKWFSVHSKPVFSWKGQRSRSSDVKNQELVAYLAYMFTFGRRIRRLLLRHQLQSRPNHCYHC